MRKWSGVLLFAAMVAGAAGCTTYKLWTESDSDPDAGTISLSYEYRKLESPRVDERAGLEMARERCADWGYPAAHRRGEERDCIDGVKSDCSRWRVTRLYRCSKEPSR